MYLINLLGFVMAILLAFLVTHLLILKWLEADSMLVTICHAEVSLISALTYAIVTANAKSVIVTCLGILGIIASALFLASDLQKLSRLKPTTRHDTTP